MIPRVASSVYRSRSLLEISKKIMEVRRNKIFYKSGAIKVNYKKLKNSNLQSKILCDDFHDVVTDIFSRCPLLLLLGCLELLWLLFLDYW